MDKLNEIIDDGNGPAEQQFEADAKFDRLVLDPVQKGMGKNFFFSKGSLFENL